MNEPLIITTESRIREIFREELAAMASTRPAPVPDEWVSVTEFCIRRRKNPKTARNSVYEKCQRGQLPARKEGKEWEINWTAYCRAGKNDK